MQFFLTRAAICNTRVSIGKHEPWILVRFDCRQLCFGTFGRGRKKVSSLMARDIPKLTKFYLLTCLLQNLRVLMYLN